MWKDSVLSPKGQVTLPKELRQALNLEAGDAIMMTVSNGDLILTPKNLKFNDLSGLLGKPPLGLASLGEIDETVANEIGRSAAAPLVAPSKGKAA